MDEPRIEVIRRGEAPQENYPGGEIHWLTSRAVNGARELTVGYTVIEVGKRNPLHRHPNCEESLYVLEGEIEHTVEGTPNVRMGPGDAILIPRDRVHQAINVGPVPARLLVSFSSAERETVILG